MAKNFLPSTWMTPYSLGSLLHYCSKTKAIQHGISLHGAVIKFGLQSNIFVYNHLINMYAKCGKISAAHKVFDEMSDRNIVSWSAMISGYDQADEPSLALNIFSQMQLDPNEYIYASIFSACASLLALPQGKQVHARALKSGYVSISFVCNSLISMYMSCSLCNDALSIFTSISEPNCISYNAMIAGFAENMQKTRGLEVFKIMNQRGVFPDRLTFVGVLGICADMENLQRGIEIHCQTIKLRLDTTLFVGNVILTMYSKCNLIEEANKVFNSIEEKDVISWNTLIASSSHCEDYIKGLKVFRDMGNCIDVRPDDFTFASVLSACAMLASFHHGSQIHAHLIRTRLHQDVGVSNAIVNMYAKCGCIRYANTVFCRMIHHNLVSWNTIIAGFGNNGLGGKALESFEKMKITGINPDSVTFIGVLVACNHAGLVDKGLTYFNSMKEIHGLEPELEHFSCLIDLLGRAGRLEEAEEYMKNYPFRNDAVVLGSLLSACRLHGNVVVGERVASRLLELGPVTGSPYVLLANLYASDGRWDGVAESRKMLKGSGVRKETGHSLIELKGIVEKFTVGDFTHPRMEEMKEILRSLGWVESEVCL